MYTNRTWAKPSPDRFTYRRYRRQVALGQRVRPTKR